MLSCGRRCAQCFPHVSPAWRQDAGSWVHVGGFPARRPCALLVLPPPGVMCEASDRSVDASFHTENPSQCNVAVCFGELEGHPTSGALGPLSQDTQGHLARSAVQGPRMWCCSDPALPGTTRTTLELHRSLSGCTRQMFRGPRGAGELRTKHLICETRSWAPLAVLCLGRILMLTDVSSCTCLI